MEADIGKCWSCKIRIGRFLCANCQFATYCSSDCEIRDQFRHEVECLNTIKVKKCHSCGDLRRGLKCCQGCYSAFYCDAQCQTSHWEDHKTICDAMGKQMLHCAADRQQMASFSGLPWFIGNTLAEEYLRLAQNEGIDTDRNLRLMFIGVGDIRDVTKTIADIPSQYRGELEFVLNDVSPHVMARNLVFLYCALTHKDADKLVQIWYSVTLTETCHKFLVKILTDFVTQTREFVLARRMLNLVNISEEHWLKCVGIWEAWLRICTDRRTDKRIQKEREKKLKYLSLHHDMVYEMMPQEHVLSFKEFMKTGVLLPLNSPLRTAAVYANPTMMCFNPFNPEYSERYDDVNSVYPHLINKWGNGFPSDTEMIYGVEENCHAFLCWDYQMVKTTVGLRSDVIEMYQIYLKQIFTTVFLKLRSEKIRFHLVVDGFEAMDECLLKSKRFDRICTSNLSDYIPIPRLLKQFGPFLNRSNPCAVLISHHQNWVMYATRPSILAAPDPQVIFRAMNDCETRPEVLPNLPQILNSPLAFCFNVTESDYSDMHPLFLISFVAEFLLYLHDYENIPFAKSSLAKVSTIPGKFSLRLRNYRKELNRVVPFYREGFARPFNGGSYAKRHLEWVPL